MVRKKTGGEVLLSARKRTIIKEIQAAIAREMAAQSEVPKSMPSRIADLLRELHRRLQDASKTPQDTDSGSPDEKGGKGAR